MIDDRDDLFEGGTDHDDADEFIAEIVDGYKASTPAPPAALQARILEAVRAEHAATDEAADTAGTSPDATNTANNERGAKVLPFRPSTWSGPAWAAAGALAATIAIGSMLAIRTAFLLPIGPVEADRLLVVDALAEAEAAERAHAEAIEQLELAVAPILAKADDPATSGADAARLAALGNQLRFIDQTIEEIQGFLATNPGHPGARETLLTAYTDKTDVLRTVIALDEEITS